NQVHTMTTKEAAEIFEVDESTIRKWLRIGKIKGCKVESSWQINRKHIEGIIDEFPYFSAEEQMKRQIANNIMCKSGVTLGDIYLHLAEMSQQDGILSRQA